MDALAAPRALSGVRVLDVTQHEAGCVTSQLLGWFGADVIKVEQPVTGDPGRKIGSPLQTSDPDPNGFDAWYFLMHNSNKRGLTLNLKDTRGHATFLALVKHADVVVENLGPGTLERLNLDYDTLKTANPAIILARIKGFGLSGQYSAFKSFDPISQATGGMMSLTGPFGGEPHRAGPSIADSSSGIMTTVGVLAALHQRTTTGRGQVVEVSMQEATMNLIRGRISDYYINEPHRAPIRRGNKLVKGVPSGVFPCKGGGPNDYVYVVSNSTLTPKVWETLLEIVGREDLIGDERYATQKLRLERKEEINAFFTGWTMQHTKHEVMELLGPRGLVCGAVLDIADLLYDPHLVGRGAITEYEHPQRGTVRVPACPVRLSDSSTETRRPPLIGEHTDEILTDLLGYENAQVESLRAAGVV